MKLNPPTALQTSIWAWRGRNDRHGQFKIDVSCTRGEQFIWAVYAAVEFAHPIAVEFADHCQQYDTPSVRAIPWHRGVTYGRLTLGVDVCLGCDFAHDGDPEQDMDQSEIPPRVLATAQKIAEYLTDYDDRTEGEKS